MSELNLFYMTACGLGAVACVVDLHRRRVPNALVIAGFTAGFILNVWNAAWQGAWASIAGCLLGGALWIPAFLLGGMGGGDVKLLVALGAILGPAEILKVSLATALAGGALALAVVFVRGRVRTTVRDLRELLGFWRRQGLKPHAELTLASPRTLKIPYAVPIAAGTLIVGLGGGLV